MDLVESHDMPPPTILDEREKAYEQNNLTVKYKEVMVLPDTVLALNVKHGPVHATAHILDAPLWLVPLVQSKMIDASGVIFVELGINSLVEHCPDDFNPLGLVGLVKEHLNVLPDGVLSR